MNTLSYVVVDNGKKNTFTGETVEDIANQLASQYGGKPHHYLDRVKNQINKNKLLNYKKRPPAGYRPSDQKPKLTFNDFLKGTNALARAVLGDHTTQEEVNRRIKICEGCPMLTDIEGCKACGMAGKLADTRMGVVRKMGAKSISFPTIKGSRASDFGCRICGCSINLISLTNLKDLLKKDGDRPPVRPGNCFINKNSSNFQDV